MNTRHRKRQHRHRKIEVRVQSAVAHPKKTKQFALKRNAYGVKQIDAAKNDLQGKTKVLRQSQSPLPVHLIRTKKNVLRKIVTGVKQTDAVRNAFQGNKNKYIFQKNKNKYIFQKNKYLI